MRLAAYCNYFSKKKKKSCLILRRANVFVSWIPRGANEAVHSLAKWSLHCNVLVLLI